MTGHCGRQIRPFSHSRSIPSIAPQYDYFVLRSAVFHHIGMTRSHTVLWRRGYDHKGQIISESHS